MQNPTPAVAGTTVPAPVTAIEVPAPGPTRPITEAEMSVIRRQRSEMSNQLTSAIDRRDELLSDIRSAPAGTEQGMMQQLQVLNDRIVRIEQDIEASGRTLRTGQVPVGITIVPPRSFANPSNSGDMERGAAIGMVVMVPIMMVYGFSRWRRRGRRRENERQAPEQDARMERLEQAVDAIALEIERVGEAQRYQTKVLAEANIMPGLNAGQRAAEPIRVKEYEAGR